MKITTPDQARRVREAIAECDRYIAKEGPRPADTRPADAQQHLDFCKQHRVKLLAMLAEVAA
jgi:hypothetical protein